MNHRRPSLWAFHALHHSAEEMSPVAAFRHHPVYGILSGILLSTFVGLCHGLAMAVFIGSVDVALLAGTNLFSSVLNHATNSLKHCHIRLRYPGWLEHVLISPDRHQVHQSIDPGHFNRNCGDALALWDWMFRTLYISKPDEEIRFGLGDATEAPLPQRHPNLRTDRADGKGQGNPVQVEKGTEEELLNLPKM